MISKKVVSHSQNQLETSFVPEILKRQLSVNPKWQIGDAIKEDHTALLWIDICNFSSLCNRLMKDTANGVEKITAILNDHYDFLLNVITEHGGEPLFFVGDGIMSAWPGEKGEASESISNALNCANEIITTRSTIDDFNELLQLHTVISYDTWHMSELESTHNKMLLSFYGEVFDNLRLVSQNRAPNQILINNSALALLPKSITSKAVRHNSSIVIHGRLEQKTKTAPKKIAMPLSKKAIERLKQFIPSTIASPISRERIKWLEEIRPVTIIFLGFFNIGKNSVAKRNEMVEIAKIAKALVVKYDGLLNMVWMDEKSTNMLICFGPSPSAHNNNPERSAKLAFELNIKLKQEGFENSIGVGTGIAYCGILGNDFLRQHTVIGDVVNLSARYAGIKGWDVVCDEATYRASKKSVNFHEPFKASVKGQSDLIELYPIKDIIGDGMLPLVTELPFLIWHNELNHLIKTFEETQDISTVIIIEGQSGMGKSKLLQEFETQSKHKWKVIPTTGNQIDRNTPYNVWGAIFSKLLNFSALETKIVQTENLERIKNRFGKQACLLNIVLNTDFVDSDLVKDLIASQKVRATHDLLLGILKEESEINKLAIIIDNAEWMDEISWNLIESVSSEIKNCNILLSFQKVKGIAHINTSNLNKYELITLNELSEVEVRELLCSKLNITMVSDEVVMLVQKIAKGNPFFCFEFVDSLLDKQLLVFENNNCALKSDVVIDELSLPETVRGAVRSRIDRLDQGSQLSLKVGSVVGQRFGKGIVSEIYPILEEREDVSYYLEEAQRSGFLNDTLVDEYEGYLFNNATTADVAYEMILTEQKRHLHKESAAWYEKNFKDKLQPFYVRLSHHWLEAGEMDKAIEYCQLESTRLFQLGFVQQALEVGLQGAKWLNYDIPRKPDSINQKIGEHMAEIGRLMIDRPIKELIHHKNLDNKDTELLIDLLLYLSPLAHQSHQPELFALMPIICLHLTLEQGNGASAAEVYSMYAIIHKAITSDSTGAFQWSNLALNIDDQNNNSLQSRVGFIHGWFIGHWYVPFRELVPMADKSADAGFKLKDILYACFNLSLSVILKSVSGVELNQVVLAAEANLKRNNQLVKNAAFHLIHEKQVAKALQGKTDDYTSLSDEYINEGKDIASICDTDMYNQIGYYLISKLKLNVHYHQWDKALEWGDRAHPLLMAFANQPGHVEFEQYYTIAALFAAVHSGGERVEKLVKIADEKILIFEEWAKHCKTNFSHKALMLKGIKMGLFGDITNSSHLLESSALQATKNGFHQDCALAYEHLAHIKQRYNIEYRQTLQSSIDAYVQWGAMAKVQYLTDKFII